MYQASGWTGWADVETFDYKF